LFIATPAIRVETSVNLPEGKLLLHNNVMLRNLHEYRGYWSGRCTRTVTCREDMLSVWPLFNLCNKKHILKMRPFFSGFSIFFI
jgi:hypothetical protein